jgi:hypothetical protein
MPRITAVGAFPSQPSFNVLPMALMSLRRNPASALWRLTDAPLGDDEAQQGLAGVARV